MQTLWQDLRYGARMLFKNPGFTLIAVITLALGIGASTVVFSLVSSLVYPPLPARVVAINGINTRTGISHLGVSLPDLDDWKTRSRSVERFAAPGSGRVRWRWGAASGRSLCAECTFRPACSTCLT